MLGKKAHLSREEIKTICFTKKAFLICYYGNCYESNCFLIVKITVSI